MHDAAHNMPFDSDPTHGPYMRGVVTPNIAYFLQQLDQIQDVNGATLLDNSVFYAGNEFGAVVPACCAHNQYDMGILVAGSGGGRLNPGYFIDYRSGDCRSGSCQQTDNRTYFYPNFLVTLLNVMGLGSSDYEVAGQPGFGAMDGAPQDFTTDRRRQPLPFFYTGPSMG
jgi:hypothetical protein